MKRIITTLAVITPICLMAQGPKKSELDNTTAVILLIIIAGLMLAITLLGNVVIGASRLYFEKYKEAKEKAKSGGAKLLSVLLFLIISNAAFSQEKTNATAATKASGPFVSGMSDTSFILMVSIIFLELLVIAALALFLKKLVKLDYAAEVEAQEAQPAFEEYREPLWKRVWTKLNSFKPMKEEADLDLGHDYDGIRELDNRLPPWWLYGFFITIFFACVYLWRYHVVHTAPLSGEEYNIAVREAAVKQEEYLAKSANNIDENNVKLLIEQADIDAGKQVFQTVCAACHKADGGGMVGPNLTDDYWLHGGSIKDVFKSIKYGWPEKGMKSWKDDYSPKQIAQIASYVKSLHGTNPPGAKEKQGDLYQEENAAPAGAPAAPAKDSAAQKTDNKVASL